MRKSFTLTVLAPLLLVSFALTVHAQTTCSDFTNSSDCPTSYVCEQQPDGSGVCIPSSGGSNSGLPAGASCNVNNDQCGSGLECDNGVCQTPGSTNCSDFGGSSDCPAVNGQEYVCEQQSNGTGVCVPSSGSGLPQGAVCDTNNDQCGNGLMCTNGTCQPNSGTSSIGSGTALPGTTPSGSNASMPNGSGSTGFPTPNISGLQNYEGIILSFINAGLVPLLVAVAFIVFLYGVANAYILHPGDEAARKIGHQYILWGIIGFVIIFSLWGIVNLVGNSLGLGPASHNQFPQL